MKILNAIWSVAHALKAMERWGCVSVIQWDQTGTWTRNKMKVQSVYIDGSGLQQGKLYMTDRLQWYLPYDAVLNNDSSIVSGKGIGNPTEYQMSKEDIPQVLSRRGAADIPLDRCSRLLFWGDTVLPAFALPFLSGYAGN